MAACHLSFCIILDTGVTSSNFFKDQKSVFDQKLKKSMEKKPEKNNWRSAAYPEGAPGGPGAPIGVRFGAPGPL